MVIDVICDGCGTACAADASLLGEPVECPACQQVFTVVDPVLAIGRSGVPVDRVDPVLPESVPDDFEVYDPRWTRPAPLPAGPLAAPPLAWADRCGIGRAAGTAVIAAGILCVFGIVSPVPVQIAMVALPVWAVGFLCVGLLTHRTPGCAPAPAAWDGWNHRPGRNRRERDERATAVVRAGLIAGAGGVAAIWGAMVHGRSVFDLTSPAAHPPEPTAVATDGPVSPDPIPAGAWSTLAVAAAPTPPVAPPPVAAPPVAASAAVALPAPSFVANPAAQPVPVASAMPAEPAKEAPPVDADAARLANEDVSVANLRAIHRALTEFVGATGGRYPSKLAELAQTPGMRAVLRSPFTAVGDAMPGPDAGYTLAGAGRSARGAGVAGLAEVYDAAELADRGVTVGITPAGRLVYLDAEQVAAQRAKWAGE